MLHMHVAVTGCIEGKKVTLLSKPIRLQYTTFKTKDTEDVAKCIENLPSFLTMFFKLIQGFTKIAQNPTNNDSFVLKIKHP